MILRKARKGEEQAAYQCIEDARAYHNLLVLYSGIQTTQRSLPLKVM